MAMVKRAMLAGNSNSSISKLLKHASTIEYR
jgi:hypothetical protein